MIHCGQTCEPDPYNPNQPNAFWCSVCKAQIFDCETPPITISAMMKLNVNTAWIHEAAKEIAQYSFDMLGPLEADDIAAIIAKHLPS